MNINDDNMIPGWLSEHKTQELLGRRNTTLWKLRKQGKLIYSKIGSRVYYKIESIQKLLEENTVGL